MNARRQEAGGLARYSILACLPGAGLCVVCTSLFLVGNPHPCSAGYLTGMMMGSMGGMDSNANRIDDNASSPVYYVTDGKTGSWNISYSGKLVIPSSDGILELILSPVERATFKNGKLMSYSFFNNRNENLRQRAFIENAKNIYLNRHNGKLRGYLYHFHKDMKNAELIMIERKKIEISYFPDMKEYHVFFGNMRNIGITDLRHVLKDSEKTGENK